MWQNKVRVDLEHLQLRHSFYKMEAEIILTSYKHAMSALERY